MIYFDYKERGYIMERKIILASHGYLAEALMTTAEMIIGPNSDMIALGLQAGIAPEEYQEALNHVFSHYPNHEFLVLIDILGGTPFNSIISQLQNKNVQVVTGVNLGMLLEVLLNQKNYELDELSEFAKEMGMNSLMTKNDLMSSNAKE